MKINILFLVVLISNAISAQRVIYRDATISNSKYGTYDVKYHEVYNDEYIIEGDTLMKHNASTLIYRDSVIVSNMPFITMGQISGPTGNIPSGEGNNILIIASGAWGNNTADQTVSLEYNVPSIAVRCGFRKQNVQFKTKDKYVYYNQN